MSLLPFLFDNRCRIFDQHFGNGMDIDELLTSMAVAPEVMRNYYRPWRSLARNTSRMDAGSKIILDKDKYQVCLDVQQFAPEEITVKTVGRQVIVEGKHEEKQDEHGFVSRHFVRKYELPQEFKPEDVVSNLSTDGVLTITAPRQKSALPEGERMVPITATGIPAHGNMKPQPSTSSEQ